MIQTTEVSITYKGDGVQTSFPYPYPYRNSDDIVGYIINDVGYEKRITNNFKYDKVSNIYQYPLAGDPLAAPYSIKLIRETPQQQNADLPGKLPFSLIEKSLDWIIMILQEIGSRCNSLWHIRNDCKLSETNARNSASAAAESEENAANSEDMAKKWAMSPVSPDGVVDTNSPTGYTQSAKIWAALSKEYAGLNKFKLPIGYYNSVDEMRKSETAIVGRPCVTLGYYEPNDGGGAVFIIRQKKESDVDDGGSVIFLNNGNVAELIIKGTVNVKQFGAKGDELTDDTKSIDAAVHACLKESEWKTLDGGWTPPKLIIPHGRYKITKPIYLTASIANWYVDMQNSIILYDGPDYAIEIWGLRYCTVRVGGVKAPNGGCIKFSQAGGNSWYQYLHLHFNWLEAKTDCILVDNTKPGWGNEVYVHGGRLVSGKYGFRFENDNHGGGGGEHWAFYNVGFESPEIGIGLHAVSSDIQWFSFYFCRHNELVSSDRVLLETTGKVHDIFWIDTQPLRNSSFNLSPETYGLHIIPNYVPPLVDGTDLDTINNPATYICETNASASTMINCPAYESFRLRVECLSNDTSYSQRQTIEIYNKNVTYVRYRPKYDKPWGSWTKVDTVRYNIELTPVHGHFISYTGCVKSFV